MMLQMASLSNIEEPANIIAGWEMTKSCALRCLASYGYEMDSAPDADARFLYRRHDDTWH